MFIDDTLHIQYPATVCIPCPCSDQTCGPAKQTGTNHKIRLASTRRHHNSVQCKLLAERFDASASAMNLFIELDDRQRTPQKWEMSIKSPSLLYSSAFDLELTSQTVEMAYFWPTLFRDSVIPIGVVRTSWEGIASARTVSKYNARFTGRLHIIPARHSP